MKYISLIAATFYMKALLTGCSGNTQQSVPASLQEDTTNTVRKNKESNRQASSPVLDTAAYKQILQHISNADTSGRWPVQHEYPKAGAVFPFKRIIAYYGNLYSKRMGILGELPKDAMWKKLQGEVNKWNQADSLLPAVPALHYIAVTAQKSPGADGKYRLRMPFHQIDTIVHWAKEMNALVFVDVQIGLSTLNEELPRLEKYLALPQVHLGIDPEFSMKTGARPGTAIGAFDAADINYASGYLAGIVKKNDLPPKVLVVHRFRKRMVTNYKKISLRPEVQIVMQMDGWGSPAEKVYAYKQFIYTEPVQFTGFKIFYKNDTKRVGQKKVLEPANLLKLTPQPVYVQYQ